MSGKLIRCICGEMYDPEAHATCPACGRPAPRQGEAPNTAPKPDPVSSGIPTWLWRAGGAALVVLVLAFGIRQLLGGGHTPTPDDHTTTSSSASSHTDSTSDSATDCASVAGTWRWFTGGSVQFTSDGKVFYATTPGGHAVTGGTWTCDAASGAYTVTWAKGFIDSLKLSDNGQHLQGSDNKGVQVSGARDDQAPEGSP